MLEVTDASVSYGKIVAVDGVSVSVGPHELTLVLGANGAGKSSLLGAIAGIRRLSGGMVKVNGMTVTGLSAYEMVRRGVVLVPEGRRVFGPMSVHENLRLGAYATSAKKVGSASREDMIYEMFPILAERRASPAGYLSGGEQQMLAFGRALMSEPRIVLMDEPTMGLAPSVVDIILNSVQDIVRGGVGVLMVEQNSEASLSIADHVIVMQRGAQIYTGPPEAAASNSAISEAFLGYNE